MCFSDFTVCCSACEFLSKLCVFQILLCVIPIPPFLNEKKNIIKKKSFKYD
jgi:hypothetical protein